MEICITNKRPFLILDAKYLGLREEKWTRIFKKWRKVQRKNYDW